MRRLVKISLVLVCLFVLVMVTGLGGLVFDKLVFYGRIAKLYTKEPDAKIAMPLPDVNKKQIANTWHAPRGTDRLHEGQDIFAPKGTRSFQRRLVCVQDW